MLTLREHEIIDEAINEASQKTSAKIHVFVVNASDRYEEFILLYGLIAGSLIGLYLFGAFVLNNALWIPAVQFGVILLFDAVPWLRKLVVRLVPKSVRHRSTARLAFQEYHAHQTLVPAGRPFVMLFVSLAERYVHVITNPVVHKRIPENWNVVTEQFGATMQSEGACAACVQAVDQIAEVLRKAYF